MNKILFKQALKLRVSDLETIVGGLSAPGKMPWGSFSTPATECQTGSKLREVEGTPCEDCFALKGRYRFKNVQNALKRRFEAMSQSGWGEHMAALLSLKAKNVKPKRRFFRWYDSGDIQSVADLETIAAIATYVPSVSFWLPTQERKYVATYLRKYNKFPANLAVRVSSTKRGKKQKSSTGLASMVTLTGSPSCPASRQGNTCGDCRKCWDKTVPLVSYPWH